MINDRYAFSFIISLTISTAAWNKTGDGLVASVRDALTSAERLSSFGESVRIYVSIMLLHIILSDSGEVSADWKWSAYLATSRVNSRVSRQWLWARNPINDDKLYGCADRFCKMSSNDGYLKHVLMERKYVLLVLLAVEPWVVDVGRGWHEDTLMIEWVDVANANGFVSVVVETLGPGTSIKVVKQQDHNNK